MRISDFRKAGHTPSLVAAFLYFDVSFMAWVLLGPLGPFIAETYKLSATQKGFLVALPLLAGSFFRPILVLVLYSLMAKDSPKRPPRPAWRDYVAVFREADTGWFCFFYCFTFGGFVGLASFLTLFFHDQYHLPKVRAGDFTTIVVIAGSFLRPVGGWLSDRIGGYRLLLGLLAGVGSCLAAISSLPSLPIVLLLLFLCMGMLGMGNGAVFQLVPQRFAKQVGVVTGLVGAAGGFGGFLLPSLLGAIKYRTGE